MASTGARRRAIVLSAFLLLPISVAAQEPQPPVPLWPPDMAAIKFDWIQLTSQEWLKGELMAMYDEELEFDSDELELQTFDWEDIQQIHTAHIMEVGLTTGAIAIGRISMDGQIVRIFGDGTIEVPRSQILTLTPWAGERRLMKWSGKVSLGGTFQRGNTEQLDVNTNANLKRRSVHDRFGLDYIANFSQSAEDKLADNQRFEGDWDHFITTRFFVTPITLEAYRDPFQNLDLRVTASTGLGYQLANTRRTEWDVSADIGYQIVRFDEVEVGGDQEEKTPSLGGSTRFEQQWTKALEFNYSYSFRFTNEQAGKYNHHMEMAFETDVTEALDFDVTLVWDRTENPRPGADGSVPEQDDYRMVVSLGIEF